MRWKERKGSILLTGIPNARMRPGITKHIETDGEAYVAMDVETGKIDRMHTPKGTFERVHEMCHAHITTVKEMRETYADVVDDVAQLTEDLRAHVHGWLWRRGNTPKNIKSDTLTFLRREKKELEQAIAKDPKVRAGTWPDFATRVRQASIRYALGEKLDVSVEKAGFSSRAQKHFARHILQEVRGGDERNAALEMQNIFFPPPPVIDIPGNSRSGRKDAPKDGGTRQPPMEIIPLKLTESIPEAKRGYRRATSGGRLHRPSLRKAVLPQKLFIRRTPREPAGTILIDASGSMGDFSEITNWIKKAPFGRIAYYAGNNRKGWLWIAADKGKRARVLPAPDSPGNTVDGPALTWLMQQPKPRVFITDRGFCGADDSEAQKIRLDMLELRGEVIVKDYAHDK